MKLSHLDDQGRARMVDVGDKPDTPRQATARGRILMKPETLALIEDEPQVVAVISGHYHTGRYDERNGIHYCTGRSMAEPPFCYATFEFTDGSMIWTDYSLSPGERRFVAGEVRTLPLR